MARERRVTLLGMATEALIEPESELSQVPIWRMGVVSG